MPTVATVLLHVHGVEYTTTPNGVYVSAPAQRVQAQPFQSLADWPLLAQIRAFWPWPILRAVWRAEAQARKAEARRRAARRRGISIMAETMSSPIEPVFGDLDPVMLAWRERVRRVALEREPIVLQYGLDRLTGVDYHVSLVGAWTHSPRDDLRRETEGRARETFGAALAEAETISARIRRSGRLSVLVADTGEAGLVEDAEDL